MRARPLMAIALVAIVLVALVLCRLESVRTVERWPPHTRRAAVRASSGPSTIGRPPMGLAGPYVSESCAPRHAMRRGADRKFHVHLEATRQNNERYRPMD